VAGCPAMRSCGRKDAVLRPAISAALGPKSASACRKTTVTMRQYRCWHTKRTIRSACRRASKSRLAQDRFFVEVQAQAARRAVGNRSAMRGKLWNHGSMSRWRLRREIGDARAGRMLQIEERAAVRDRRHSGPIAGSHRDASQTSNLAEPQVWRGFPLPDTSNCSPETIAGEFASPNWCA